MHTVPRCSRENLRELKWICWKEGSQRVRLKYSKVPGGLETGRVLSGFETVPAWAEMVSLPASALVMRDGVSRGGMSKWLPCDQTLAVSFWMRGIRCSDGQGGSIWTHESHGS